MYAPVHHLTLLTLHHWLPHLQRIALVEASLDFDALWVHPPLWLLEWSEEELDCTLPAQSDCWLEWKDVFLLGYHLHLMCWWNWLLCFHVTPIMLICCSGLVLTDFTRL